MNIFKVSYVTTLPKLGNVPKVTISGDTPRTYLVKVYEGWGNLTMSGLCETNQTIIFKGKQFFTDWIVDVEDGAGNVVFKDIFSPYNKKVFIKMDAFALGDNIAWMPYVEQFRKKYHATVICSTFFNHLFVENYPEILFVKPNTIIDNVYTQYYIGAANDESNVYAPIKVNEWPLQMIASKILGLPYTEIKPTLNLKYCFTKPRHTRKYVTLSEFGSSPEKEWKVDGGWQKIVDYIVDKGYDVYVISKEPTNLKNIINLTGDISLDERAIDIYHAKLHLGISSGLSWLAWGLGKHVVMISDCTPNWHEFSSSITRFCANDLLAVDYSANGKTTIEEVIEKLDGLLSL